MCSTLLFVVKEFEEGKPHNVTWNVYSPRIPFKKKKCTNVFCSNCLRSGQYASLWAQNTLTTSPTELMSSANQGLGAAGSCTGTKSAWEVTLWLFPEETDPTISINVLRFPCCYSDQTEMGRKCHSLNVVLLCIGLMTALLITNRVGTHRA